MNNRSRLLKKVLITPPLYPAWNANGRAMDDASACMLFGELSTGNEAAQ
jgi:hypothetical protein